MIKVHDIKHRPHILNVEYIATVSEAKDGLTVITMMDCLAGSHWIVTEPFLLVQEMIERENHNGYCRLCNAPRSMDKGCPQHGLNEGNNR